MITRRLLSLLAMVPPNAPMNRPLGTSSRHVNYAADEDERANVESLRPHCDVIISENRVVTKHRLGTLGRDEKSLHKYLDRNIICTV